MEANPMNGQTIAIPVGEQEAMSAYLSLPEGKQGWAIVAPSTQASTRNFILLIMDSVTDAKNTLKTGTL